MSMHKNNMLLPAVMQVTGNICETLNFSGVMEQFYWIVRKLKRELPSAQGYNDYNFHIKTQLVEKKKMKLIRSPVNLVVEESMSSQQDGYSKFYQSRECNKTYKNKRSQTVKI